MKKSKIKIIILILGNSIPVSLLLLLFFHNSESLIFNDIRSPLWLGISIASVILCHISFLYVYLKGLSKFCGVYSFISVTLLSIILFFLLSNTIAYVANHTVANIILRYSPPLPDKETQNRRQAMAELVGLDLNELNTLFRETWHRAWEYAPWIGFKERPRQGQYVNVSKNGYRITLGSLKTAKRKIFMFGGSTTFGYNVADGQTISSYLQKKINDTYGSEAFQVRNYGRAYYYSTQEYILLWQLLKRGEIPDIVIFLDYLNDQQSDPYYTKELRILFESRQKKLSQQALENLKFLINYGVHTTPVYKLLFKNAKHKSFTETGPCKLKRPPPESAFEEYIFNNRNIRALCIQHKISPFFFIGPVPGFRNSYKTHLFLDKPIISEDRKRLMEMLASSASVNSFVTDLSGILEDYKRQPFVDTHHYTPQVNQIIADKMFRKISGTLASTY